jgi:hypothetical protein
MTIVCISRHFSRPESKLLGHIDPQTTHRLRHPLGSLCNRGDCASSPTLGPAPLSGPASASVLGGSARSKPAAAGKPCDDYPYGEAVAGFPHPGRRSGPRASRPNRPRRHDPWQQPDRPSAQQQHLAPCPTAAKARPDRCFDAVIVVLEAVLPEIAGRRGDLCPEDIELQFNFSMPCRRRLLAASANGESPI